MAYSLAFHLKVCESAVQTKFGRPMNAIENAAALKMYENGIATKLYEKHAAPESASPVKKQEKPMSESIFKNIIEGTAPTVAEFNFTPKGLAMDRKAPMPGTESSKDATRPAQYPADSFLAPSPDGDLVSPVGTPYVMHSPGTITPDLLPNFVDPNAPDQTGDRAMFKPSTPGPLRLGNARQLDAGTAVPVFKSEGMFTDLLLGEEK